ncbi:MAG TPA: hypothetical protein VK803_03905 [Steroidobacteraceae bacterium]|jgi:hypothetical protein|nr:hypothetical protein [Steroidobacteraceae bacterium]
MNYARLVPLATLPEAFNCALRRRFMEGTILHFYRPFCLRWLMA